MEIPDIYTDSGSDSSDDDSIENVIPAKKAPAKSKAAPKKKGAKAANGPATPSAELSNDASHATVDKALDASTSQTPERLDSDSSKPTKAAQSSPKKSGSSSPKKQAQASEKPKKEPKKAVKKETKASKASNKDKDHIKEIVKAASELAGDGKDKAEQPNDALKDAKEGSNLQAEDAAKKADQPAKEAKKRGKKAKSAEGSETPSPKPKKTKKGAAEKADGATTPAEEPAKEDLKRKADTEAAQKPAKKKAKAAKATEATDAPAEPAKKGKQAKSAKTEKKADAAKASPVKAEQKDRMTNDNVFDALSELDDLPLYKLKRRLMGLPDSSSDSESDSDSDSDAGFSRSVVESKPKAPSPKRSFMDYAKKVLGVGSKSPEDSDKAPAKPSDTHSDDSDDSDDSDVLIKPVKPSGKGAASLAKGGSPKQDEPAKAPLNGFVKAKAQPVQNDLITTDSDDSDDSDDSVKPVPQKEASSDSPKESYKRPREDAESDESPSKHRAAEHAGDKFTNKERLQSINKARPEIPQGCEIYCGNLPVNITEDELRELFEECGLITRINKLNKRGIAFITFSNQESAQKAADYNNSPYKGQLLNINITSNRPPKPRFGSKEDFGKFGRGGDRKLGEQPAVSNEVCVRNLNFNSSEEGLRELFSECGQVTRCYLPKFQDSGKPMGICFISFTTVEGAKRAVEYDQTEIDGRTVSIQYAMPRNRNGFKGRATKGRFTTGSSRVSTFRAAAPDAKFGKPRGGHDRPARFEGASASASPSRSEGLESARPKSIIFDDDDE